MPRKKQEPDPRPPAADLLPASKQVTPRPTEVKAIVGLLSEPADDATALAKAIVLKLDSLRFGKTTWGVVVQLPAGDGVGFVTYGPYPTRKSAETAEKIVGNVFPGRTRVTRITNKLSPPECPSSYYA